MLKYNVIEIFTNEGVRHKGKALWRSITEYVAKKKIAARCIVTKGIAGCYENGEIATHGIELLSFNMPLKIEIVLPHAELKQVLPEIEDMVDEGIVVVEDMDVVSHRVEHHLIPAQLLVKDVMTENPRSVSPTTNAADILSVLLSSGFHSLPVIDDSSRPIGIITQGDLMKRGNVPLRLGLIEEISQSNRDAILNELVEKEASDVMTSPIVSILETSSLREAVSIMLEKGLKRLPVVDQNGRLTGMLARLDIFEAISHTHPEWSRVKEVHAQIENVKYVKDVMVRDMYTISPDTTVLEIVRIIDANDIQRVAVVDREGKLLGLISDRHVLSAFPQGHSGFWNTLISKGSFFEALNLEHDEIRALGKLKASDIMNERPDTVREDSLLDEAIRIMTAKGIKRLPVVDDQGKFRGLLSRDGILRFGMKH